MDFFVILGTPYAPVPKIVPVQAAIYAITKFQYTVTQ
jgi:hypothetical protein